MVELVWRAEGLHRSTTVLTTVQHVLCLDGPVCRAKVRCACGVELWTLVDLIHCVVKTCVVFAFEQCLAMNVPDRRPAQNILRYDSS